jgi:nucleotide-binding universal stress UspA family protein
VKQKRFLVATDGSAGACEAVQQATALARESGAAITLVCVRHAPLPLLGDSYYQRTSSAELARAQAVLDEARARVAAGGVEVETEILEGNPADSIAGLARSRSVDLIVAGSRGRGGIAGRLLGSVAAGIVHRGDRPILIVKPRGRPARQAA